MKSGRNESSSKKLVSGGAAAWLLLPLLVLVVLKTDSLPQITMYSVDGVPPSPASDGEKDGDVADSIKDFNREQQFLAVNGEVGVSSVNSDSNHEKHFLAMNGEKDASLINSDVAAPILRSNLSCNFSSVRMNVCSMEGDVRIQGKSSTVYVVSVFDYRPENSTVIIRPYPRKWEIPTMELVREVTVRSTAPPPAPGVAGAMAMDDDTAPPPPRCTVTHDVPAVVFSTGGYSMNFFHAMTDVVVPLYNTARRYDGRVQLLATNYDRKWVAKFRHVLGALSAYPVIDFDADAAVRCFPSAHVGIESHMELSIDPALSFNGDTMMDFRDFLRSAYSLKRSWTTPVSRNSSSSSSRPRLVILLRRHSRAMTNEGDAMAAATEAGFEVVPAGPEVFSDMAKFAEVVNSCDVMVGVHGAGLTNMVFLPHNGTVVQIIPWGGMKWPCFHALGRPVPDMGLRYVEYEANAEETTLKDVYPRDHAVFTDPLSIHRQGYGMMWTTFLDGQNVTLDIGRFRGVMEQLYQSVTFT